MIVFLGFVLICTFNESCKKEPVVYSQWSVYGYNYQGIASCAGNVIIASQNGYYARVKFGTTDKPPAGTYTVVDNTVINLSSGQCVLSFATQSGIFTSVKNYSVVYVSVSNGKVTASFYGIPVQSPSGTAVGSLVEN